VACPELVAGAGLVSGLELAGLELVSGPGLAAGSDLPGRQRSGDIRAWAKEAGITVSERGRIPANVVEQHEAATKGR
jgi:hypothetical protein